jgi:predicted nucleic-acid-binding Zn-ribbon protein
MRTTATCPKCSGKKLIVVHERGFLRDTKVIGRFESWICAACGYTEFYAKDLADVDALASQWPEDVRIVDSTVPRTGPFR